MLVNIIKGGVFINKYKTTGIYRITNKINGMSYIGKTLMNFGDRWDSHRSKLRNGYHDNPNLQKEWNDYGEDNFEFSIIEVISDKDKLNIAEQSYIRKYKNLNLSYNIHDGGDTGVNLGKHLSDETKRKIGEKNKINMTGRKLSDETKHKMAASQKKRYENMSDEEKKIYGENISRYSSGYKWSEDSKKNFSIKQHTSPNAAKYDVNTVKEIRRLHEEVGMSYKDIANKLNINRHTVYLIATYRRWKNI